MKIWKDTLPFHPTHPLTTEYFTEATILFDIETTGLSPAHTHVYLIGCATRNHNAIQITQFFAETPKEEPKILEAFSSMLSHYGISITYNGLGFDIPYLNHRYAHHCLLGNLDNMKHLDLFRELSKYKNLLKLPDFKQKTLEHFLGLQRNDPYSGKELIELYSQSLAPSAPTAHTEGSSATDDPIPSLKQHNYEDVLAMASLLSALSYQKLFTGNFQICSVEQNAYQDFEGKDAQELIFSLETDYPLPQRISYGSDGIYLTGQGRQIKLSVRIIQAELLHFYPNYKDYYYLPAEGKAIHKSVASYVDKDYRTAAKASNCYAKKNGCFLPQYQELSTPCFQRAYRGKELYFELECSFLDSPDSQKKYALHLLQHIL